jgi:hypothetical protein
MGFEVEVIFLPHLDLVICSGLDKAVLGKLRKGSLIALLID